MHTFHREHASAESDAAPYAHEPAERLLLVGSAVAAQLDEVRKKLHLSRAELVVLSDLTRTPRTTVSSLCDRHPTAMLLTLPRLIKMSYVTIEGVPGTRDARISTTERFAAAWSRAAGHVATDQRG